MSGAHRAELDRARAAIIFDEGIGRVTGYMLSGRRDIQSGVREALKPIESWGANQQVMDAPIGTDNFDFLVEGVPTLIANQEEANYLPNYHAASDTLDKVDFLQLKINTAIAGVTAFGVADDPSRRARANPALRLNPLKNSGLEQQMKRWACGRPGNPANVDACRNPGKSGRAPPCPYYSPNHRSSEMGSIRVIILAWQFPSALRFQRPILAPQV